ncbi:hypothetical protein Pan44_07590 [Caulifigura coniformis]|uniref:Cytochrome c domain-containing protein n=1 Tax=Caulifigura coniformis TaxID=2527983 RepID=A0A517S9D5_9PLAN|nr:hypothetical protein [Caulifigura coniformis]QDT52747.1 hypothetical protein Pan44_07590 [Caulifigura coniformis]
MKTGILQSILLVSLIVATSVHGIADDNANEVFARRILPLAKADKPSSCTECHAAGVNLSQYIRDDASATFVALRSAGLVNSEQPEKSKLLELIARAPDKGDPLLAKIRAEELEAFRTWISAAAKDAQIAGAPASSAPIGPTLPPEVIRHARRDRVLASFIENIWIERERCAGCHSPDKNQRVVKEHGDQISWIVSNDAAGTLAKIINHGLINLDDPNKSKILQKPLGEVEHGGHVKFTRGTRTDKQFRRFLDDYVATLTGKYHTAAELPQQPDLVVVATAQHLRVVELPRAYAEKLMRIDLHRWTDDGWTSTPVASVDGRGNPKNAMFQGVVFATLPRTMDIAKEVETRRQLPGGRYLAKFYVDQGDRTAKNRDYEFGESDLVGQVEFDGPWPAGYSPPKIIKSPEVASGRQ